MARLASWDRRAKCSFFQFPATFLGLHNQELILRRCSSDIFQQLRGAVEWRVDPLEVRLLQQVLQERRRLLWEQRAAFQAAEQYNKIRKLWKVCKSANKTYDRSIFMAASKVLKWYAFIRQLKRHKPSLWSTSSLIEIWFEIVLVGIGEQTI